MRKLKSLNKKSIKKLVLKPDDLNREDINVPLFIYKIIYFIAVCIKGKDYIEKEGIRVPYWMFLVLQFLIILRKLIDIYLKYFLK